LLITIDSRLIAQYPSLCIGVVAARAVNNRTPGAAAQLLAVRVAAARQALGTMPPGQHPRIIPWRNAYSAFGAKPSKYNSSVEALLRRVQKGDALPSINPLVDLYNAVSLQYVIPVGGDDLAKVEGNIALTYAAGNERYVPLHSSAPEPPRPGEVVYADERDILCRRWNWREGDKTKLTEETQEAVLFLEGLSPVTREEIAAAARELAELIAVHCAGQCTVHLLTADALSCEI
jgi:DNA/RNA-binding domain of Phe-tRNA-synthetase-like protein